MWHQPREFKSAPRGFVVIIHILWPWDLVQTSPLKITQYIYSITSKHNFFKQIAIAPRQVEKASHWEHAFARERPLAATFAPRDAFAARLWCCLSVVSTLSWWSPSVSHHRLHYRCLPSYQSFCPHYHHHRQAWIDVCGVCVLFPGQADELGAVLACIH